MRIAFDQMQQIIKDHFGGAEILSVVVPQGIGVENERNRWDDARGPLRFEHEIALAN